jgi:HAD superfamily hydrolase (TIGR01549 family)
VEIVKFVSENLSVNLDSARVLLKERRRELVTLTRALESLGVDRNVFFESMATRIDPADYLSEDANVNAVIATLRRQGFKVGLVSNSGRPLVEKILKAIRLDSSTFDAIVTSSDAQPKPSREPFLLAMSLMRCGQADVIYVGDRDEAELHPAKEIGIRTILLDRTGLVSPRWADAVVRNLSEIPRVANAILRN